MTEKEKKESAETIESGSERTRLSGHFELDLPKTEHQTGETSKKKKTFPTRLGNDLQKPRFYIEIAALIVVICYTRAAYEANQNATKALQVTERAYVNVQEVKLGQPFANMMSEPAEAIVSYKNSGLTPARQLTVDPRCGVAPSVPHDESHERAAHFVTQLFAAQQSCETKPDGEVLPPGVTRHKNTNVRKATGQPTMNEEFNCRFSSDDYRDIKKGVAWWYVGASISYLDQFGHCHWSGETFIYNPETDEFDPLVSGFKQIDPQT